MFKKILIANRGEIALRIIRASKEMGIKTVAVYSTADRDSLHVKYADEAVCIGPPPGFESYLNMSRVLAAAEITNADAIHPGYGFLSENPKFSELCKKYKIKFIGCESSMIMQMGDKATAKETMKKAGVPCVPGSEGLILDFEDAKRKAKDIGFPVMLKATAGGGGKGMRRVFKEEELENAWDSARQEAKVSFGNDGMYMEKLILEPRHIEIQVAGDQHGNGIHLSERDCSIQRRNQKLLEETPSPFMTNELRKKMGDVSAKAVCALGYEGVGTIEYLVDKDRNFYFMEMNTRIQVEHPITEQVVGCDLIKEQIKIAAGEKLSTKDQFPTKHSIECRINAENPAKNFAPSPGPIASLNIPGGNGIRVDSHIYAGYVIPPHYDSMIAKLIVTGEDRKEAISKMKRALDEFVIEGIKTTIPFHKALMENEDFLNGNYTTKFMDDFVFEEK